MSDNWLAPITRTFDSAVVDELFTALTTVGEGKRIAAGLTALSERHACNTRTDVVHVNPWTIILVISSRGGCWSSREVELQVPLTEKSDLCRSGRRAPTLWVSGSDNELHHYVVPRTLAYWAARRAIQKIGTLRACEDGIVPSYDISGYLEPSTRDMPDMPADSGLFLGLGLYALAQQIEEATRPRERFAPVPEDRPLVLRREHPWSPADHEVPAGTIVEDALDLPADAVFTAVWYDSRYPGYDVSDGRGVSPLLRLIDSPEANGMAITAAEPTGSSTWRQWAPRDVSKRTLYGWRYVIHTGAGPTLRELGGSRSFDDFITVDKTEKHHFKNPVALPDEADGGYTGPLPGEPHRRIQRRSDGRRTTVELDIEINGEWVWLDYAGWSFDTVDDADVRKVAEELLRRNDLCWADIDGAEIKILDDRTPDRGVVEEPKPPLRRSRFLQWVSRLAKQSSQTDQ